MEKSDQINELAAALAKAQSVMDFPHLDSENPAFKREGKAMRYPSLRSVIEAFRPALTANGLSLIQTFEPSEPTCLVITTVLLHESGQWLSGTCSFPVEKPGPQGYASASTYARRYSLMAMVGLAPDDDDDGNAAPAPRFQVDSRGDQRAAAPATKEREELIGQVHRAFKAGHEGEKFYPWASGVLKREVATISDLEYADLRALDRHLRVEAAAQEGQARASGQLDPGASPEPPAMMQGA